MTLQTSKSMTIVQYGELSRKFNPDQRIVYFIQENKNRGAIKIGLSTNSSFLGRFYSLQIGNPNELIILGIRIGDDSIEGKLHHEFRKYRIRGEWFKETDVILHYIEDRCIEPIEMDIQTFVDMSEKEQDDWKIEQEREIEKIRHKFHIDFSESPIYLNSRLQITKSARRKYLEAMGKNIDADTLNGAFWRQWISEGEDG